MGKTSALGILLDKASKDPNLFERMSKDKVLREKMRDDAMLEVFFREAFSEIFKDGVFKAKFICPECKKEIETDKINAEVLFFDVPDPDFKCPHCGTAIKISSILGDIAKEREHAPIIFMAMLFKVYGAMVKEGVAKEIPELAGMVKLSEELLSGPIIVRETPKDKSLLGKIFGIFALRKKKRRDQMSELELIEDITKKISRI